MSSHLARELAVTLSSGAGALARLLAPNPCASCDAPLAGPAVFCAECGGCPPLAGADPDAGIRVAGKYAPPLSTAIMKMKFGHRADLAYRLAELLPLEPDAVNAETLIVPVPLHLLRLCERGFNPAALMARSFAQRAGATFAPRLLERLRHTARQSSLAAGERRHNVSGAFTVRSDLLARQSAAGRHAVLVDDVVTTGSTIAACTGALYAAGVVHVRVIALARAGSRA